MKTTFKEFYLSERRGNVSKNNKVIMIHGTSNKFLKSILSQGLIPDVKIKAWQNDDEASYDMPSRKSYGGIYFSSNIITAISSARNTVRKLGGSQPLIIVTELQPRTSLPDEDDFQGIVRYATDNAVTYEKFSPNEFQYIKAYGDYLKKNNEYEDSKEIFRNYIIQNFLKDKKYINIFKNNTKIMSKLNDLYDKSILRKIAYIDSFDVKRYLSDYDFNYDTVDQYVIKNKSEVENNYMKSLDKVISLFKQNSYDIVGFENEKDNTIETLRIIEPITYSGANKIICIFELTNYFNKQDNEEPYKIKIYYGDIPNNILKSFNDRISSNYEII